MAATELFLFCDVLMKISDISDKFRLKIAKLSNIYTQLSTPIVSKIKPLLTYTLRKSNSGTKTIQNI